MANCTVCYKPLKPHETYGSLREPLCWACWYEYGEDFETIGAEGYEPYAFDDDGDTLVGGRTPDRTEQMKWT